MFWIFFAWCGLPLLLCRCYPQLPDRRAIPVTINGTVIKGFVIDQLRSNNNNCPKIGSGGTVMSNPKAATGKGVVTAIPGNKMGGLFQRRRRLKYATGKPEPKPKTPDREAAAGGKQDRSNVKRKPRLRGWIGKINALAHRGKSSSKTTAVTDKTAADRKNPTSTLSAVKRQRRPRRLAVADRRGSTDEDPPSAATRSTAAVATVTQVKDQTVNDSLTLPCRSFTTRSTVRVKTAATTAAASTVHWTCVTANIEHHVTPGSRRQATSVTLPTCWSLADVADPMTKRYLRMTTAAGWIRVTPDKRSECGRGGGGGGITSTPSTVTRRRLADSCSLEELGYLARE